MKGKKGIENKEASYTYTLPTYRLLLLKFSGSASNHTPRSIWACYSHHMRVTDFFLGISTVLLRETLVQRYLKVVAFYATMFIILPETLCNEHSVSIFFYINISVFC